MRGVLLGRHRLRRLYWLRERDPVPEELRGWSYSTPPVRPKAYLGLGVSEFAYRYCETMRDLWLRRRAGAQPRVEPGSPVHAGRVAHQLVDAAARDVRRLLAEGRGPHEAALEVGRLARRRASEAGAPGDRRAEGFYVAVAFALLAEGYAKLVEGGDGQGILPLLTEYRVDGSPLGLSQSLRVDALGEAGVVVEFKLGWTQGGADRYAVGLAGYAMALESEIEAPVDFGVLVFFSELGPRPRVRSEPVYLGSRLRREFLELRDEAIEVLMSRSPPPKASRCPDWCPLREQCGSLGGDRRAPGA